MTKSLFGFKSYKDVLNTLVSQGERGTRRRMASFCKCQESYVSNVLNGSSHLNSEQIEAACRFFRLSKTETQYLILLHQENRASTNHLKQHLREMLESYRKEHDVLKDRLEIKETITIEDQSRYYSDWYYSAVHMAVQINELRKPDAIARKLKIPIEKVIDTLSFLRSIGLVIKRNEEFLPQKSQLHLDKSSPCIVQHHRNWRLKAASSMALAEEEGLHYSAVVTISRDDFEKVREIYSNALKASVGVIKDSKDEHLALIGLDFMIL